MAKIVHPIVQAEFMGWESDADVAAILGGAFQKLSLRVFDEKGELSIAIRKSSAAEDAKSALLQFVALHSPQINVPNTIFPCLDSLLQLKAAYHAQAVSLVKSLLNEAVRKEHPVAMENRDRTFRPARETEVHVALEAAQKATAVNLFLFPPNDLLAHKHESSVRSFA